MGYFLHIASDMVIQNKLLQLKVTVCKNNIDAEWKLVKRRVSVLIAPKLSEG